MNEAVSIKILKKHIFVNPGSGGKQKAVKAALCQDKKKYSTQLAGAVLGVRSVRIHGDRHLLIQGCLSMEVTAELEVFCPKVNMEMEGIVNKRSHSHCGCLIMETFNGSLTVPPELGLDPKEGDTCKFRVTEVVVKGEIMFVRGAMISCQSSMASLSTGKSIMFSDEDDNDKKNDKSEFMNKTEWVEITALKAKDNTDNNDISKAKKTPKKRKKSQKDLDDVLNVSQIKKEKIDDFLSEEELTTPKRKKSKVDKSNLESSENAVDINNIKKEVTDAEVDNNKRSAIPKTVSKTPTKSAPKKKAKTPKK